MRARVPLRRWLRLRDEAVAASLASASDGGRRGVPAPPASSRAATLGAVDDPPATAKTVQLGAAHASSRQRDVGRTGSTRGAVSREALNALSSDAPEDASVSTSAPNASSPDAPPPDAFPRCADLDPTPASCAASHPGRAFARCRWTVGPVYACGRRAPPPSARALVCICNGCRTASDCPPGSACTSLGYPCGPLASVCMNSGLLGNLDMGAYHDDHGRLRLGAREDYAGRTPALRAPCAP